MADPQGFIKHPYRQDPPKRPVPLRLMDWKEVQEANSKKTVQAQASRCMDCGVPFCHQGCPLGNYIPDWNRLAWEGRWDEGSQKLYETNNFPEITGRVCPAPCESACVLNINQPAVTIKQIEYTLGEEYFENGHEKAAVSPQKTDKKVAVIGSGPAGLAAAQQLTKVGHDVTVYEQNPEIGGLLRYGIPDFKLEKTIVDRRISQMREEGTSFIPDTTIGVDLSWDELEENFDSVIIATGATVPRPIEVKGADLKGIHYAMDYLTASNKTVSGYLNSLPPEYDVKDKVVVVLGGGDTGADCIGTAHRQGAKEVLNYTIGLKPPQDRPDHQPWPVQPHMFEVSSSHEEGGERIFSSTTVEFLADKTSHVNGLKIAETDFSGPTRTAKEHTIETVDADIVFLALGFTGVDSHLTNQAHIELTDRNTIKRDTTFMTNKPGVFTAGDSGRGQSLVVWAIAEGRSAAAEVDKYLMGSTQLVTPVTPMDQEFRL